MTHMWSEILEQPEVFVSCLEKNNQKIKEIVEVVKANQIDSVMIAARGTSDHAGVYAKYMMEITLGIPVTLAAPSVFTMYGKSLKLANTLVIGISQSGKAADVVEVLKSANAVGMPTVSITNYEDSPLALEAKYHLHCNAGVEKSVAATKTFIAQLALLATLTAEWSGNEELKQELSLIPQKLQEVIAASGAICERVQRYRYMNECFVLARGVNYAIALEGALKIQETCYVRAKAYATSDFYHGPYAMIDKEMPVLVFAPDGPSAKDVEEMIHRLKGNGAELVIISNRKDLRELGASSFAIPETANDMITPFYNIVIAQMFACQLALAKGLDPDNPRGLNKVTITK